MFFFLFYARRLSKRFVFVIELIPTAGNQAFQIVYLLSEHLAFAF